MTDLEALEPGTEVTVKNYIELAGSQRLMYGNILKIRGCIPKTGEPWICLWIPPYMRDTGKHEVEWMELIVRRDELGALGKVCTVRKN